MSSTKMVLTRKFGLTVLENEMPDLVPAFIEFEKTVNFLIRQGVNLDAGTFESDGILASKRFYNKIRKTSAVVQFTSKLVLRERAWRCAAEYAYFSIREFKRRCRLLSVIAGVLGDQGDLSIFSGRKFPSRKLLATCREKARASGVEKASLSREFLSNMIRHARNLLKGMLVQKMNTIQVIRQNNEPVTRSNPEMDTDLVHVHLLKFLRVLSRALTGRVKQVLKKKGTMFGNGRLDGLIGEILAGQPLALATWKKARREWRETMLERFRHQLSALVTGQLLINVREKAIAGFSLQRAVTLLFGRDRGVPRPRGDTREDFEQYLISSLILGEERKLLGKYLPYILPLLRGCTGELRDHPETWAKVPVFKKHSLPVSMDDSQVYFLEHEKGDARSGPVLVSLSFRPRQKMKFSLKDPGRFWKMVDQGCTPKLGVVMRRGKRLILAIPFEYEIPAGEELDETTRTKIDLGLKTLAVASVQSEEGGDKREIARYFIDQRKLAGNLREWMDAKNEEPIEFFNFKRRLVNLQREVRGLQAKLARVKARYGGRYRHKVRYWRLRREWKRKWGKIKTLHGEMTRQLAARIVAACRHHRSGVLQFEDLKWSRHSRRNEVGYFLSTMQIHWFFAQVIARATTMARKHGIQVELVDARNTSKTCSRCGERGKRDGKIFHCPRCGLILDSDLNAARNIGDMPASIPQPPGEARGGRPVPPTPLS